MNHPVIIGAGGVASYLLPVLLKTFRPQKLTIIDKDILEERNLDRQMFDADQVGQAKVMALLNKVYGPKWLKMGAAYIENWFSDSTLLEDDVDCIICCADNHEARHAAMQRAIQLGCYAYIGGNEYLDSQAFVFHPSFQGTDRDPYKRYPEIATSHEGSPFRCTGEAQVSSPQLAIANLNCAAKLLHLMWVYERWLPENRQHLVQGSIEALPCELFTSLIENSRL